MLTQMNTRIDTDVKRRGDLVFAELGYTPSQVVRAMWQYAADHGDAPDMLRAALESLTGDKPESERNRRSRWALDGASIFADFRREFDMPAPDMLEDIDYAALRDDAFDDCMAQRGLA